MISKGKSSRIFQILTMDFDPGYKYIEKFRWGVQWYMINTNDFFQVIVLN